MPTMNDPGQNRWGGVAHSVRRVIVGYPEAALAVACAILLFTAYVTVFATTTDDSTTDILKTSLINTAPAVALAVVLHRLLAFTVWTRPTAVQLLVQLPLAIVFAVAWYFAVLVGNGAREGWLAEGFSVRPFVPVAFAWQMFQGVTLYAVAALFSQTVDLRAKLRADGQTKPEDGSARTIAPTPRTLLIRRNGEAERADFDEIVRISGAGDYVEIVLIDRTILSSSTLGDLEGAVPADAFVRAHRSHLVRLAAVRRAEPAGNGRTTLHLVNGDSIVTSRAGSRAIRDASY